MKFGKGVLYKKLMIKNGLCGNECSEKHNLLKDVNEMLPVFSAFFIRFG
jgi:hypothetical protein